MTCSLLVELPLNHRNRSAGRVCSEQRPLPASRPSLPLLSRQPSCPSFDCGDLMRDICGHLYHLKLNELTGVLSRVSKWPIFVSSYRNFTAKLYIMYSGEH